MADSPRQKNPEERMTLNVLRIRERLYLPAKVGGKSLRFNVDTGSRWSVVSRSAVPEDQIKPCKKKKIAYLSHTVKLCGQTYLTLVVGNGSSAKEIQYPFLVAKNDFITIQRESGKSDEIANKPENHLHATDLIAMDFLTDFQCEIDINKQTKLTMNRKHCAIQEDYQKPFLKIDVACKGKSTPKMFLIDTGASSMIPLDFAVKNQWGIVLAYQANGVKHYSVKEKVTIRLGEMSRNVQEMKACEKRYSILGA